MDDPNPMGMEEFSWDLPVELVAEVLARLPVRSLVRFRCVCKAWCALISSSDFASLHLVSYHKNDNDALILAAGMCNCWAMFSGHAYEDITFTSYDYAILIDSNIMDAFDDYFIHGCSVNGLLLLSTNAYDRLERRWYYDVVIRNPLIGKTRKVLTDCVCNDVRLGVPLGFGFCSSTNDYKVVAVATKSSKASDHFVPFSALHINDDTERKTSVHVYSLSTSAWTSVTEYDESIISELMGNGNSLIEGKIHFFSFMNQTSYMVVFDVEDEVFSYIELPSKVASVAAVVYHEMVGHLDFDIEKRCCNLWVMEDDQVPGRWHKLFTIPLHPRIYFYQLCFKKNEEFVLLSKGHFADLYTVKSGEMKRLREVSSYFPEYATLYKESLVLL